MLIQLTNRCRMGCPHCLQDSRPDGGLMNETTFENALRLAHDCGCVPVVLSGGEPTEHPRFVDFCRRASQANVPFSVSTNGMWLGDEGGEYRFEKVARLKGFAGAQVYSNPKWYRLHEETVARYSRNAKRWQDLGVNLDTPAIRNMLDSGRAAACEAARKEAAESKYHCSCLVAHLTAVQITHLDRWTRPGRLLYLLAGQGHFCTPMVDWRGEFHASESWLCQSFGNVNRDDRYTLFDSLARGRPCGRCSGGRRYLSEDTPEMAMARRLLGQLMEAGRQEGDDGKLQEGDDGKQE